MRAETRRKGSLMDERSRSAVRTLCLAALLASSTVESAAQCDPAAIVCTLAHDNRPCSTRSCIGIVIQGNCKGWWQDHNDLKCEAEKLAQNKIYEAQHAVCEAGKVAATTACATVAATAAAVATVTSTREHIVSEVTEIGMRILPGEVRDGVVHLTKELAGC
jgi:hypothetical protein